MKHWLKHWNMQRLLKHGLGFVIIDWRPQMVSCVIDFINQTWTFAGGASTGPSLHIKPWCISVFDFFSLFLNCCKLFRNFQKSLSDNHCHSILTSNGWLSKASSLSDSTVASFFWKVDHNLHLASESYFLAPWVIIFQTCCTWSDSSETKFLGTEQCSIESRPPQF